MEPVSGNRVREEIGVDAENAIMDRKFSDGQVGTLFLAELQDEREYRFWLRVDKKDARDLLRSAIKEARSSWSRERIEQEADRLENILGRALFFRMKMDICHQAQRALTRLGADLHIIASDDEKLLALRRELESLPEGKELLKNLCGRGWNGSSVEFRGALLDLAKKMGKLAEGLHVKDLLHRQDPLREMPELVRSAYRRLPEGSFSREIFGEQLNAYQEQREFERDLLTIWKGVCGATALFASAGAAALVLKGNGIANSVGEIVAGSRSFEQATEWALAARVSGGAGSDDFQKAIQRRDLMAKMDGVGVAFSVGFLAVGELIPELDKALSKTNMAVVKALPHCSPVVDPNGGGGERLDQIIHRLAGS